MTNSLILLLLAITLSLSILLISHRHLLTSLGPTNTYRLWLLVPLSLTVTQLPLNQLVSPVTFATIERLVVTTDNVLTHSANKYWMWYGWATITAGLLIFWLSSHFLYSQRILRESQRVPQHNWTLPNPLTVIRHQHIRSPMLIGILRQYLVIPTDFETAFDHEQQALIIAHEVQHFRRFDLLWNLMALVLLAAFWFHPLAWLAWFRFRHDQELSCDQSVLARKHTQSRINYSKALVTAASHRHSGSFVQLLFKKYGDQHMMFERIEQIKKNTNASKKSLVQAAILSLTLLSGISLSGITLAGNHHATDKHAEKDAGPMPVVRYEPVYPKEAAQQSIEGSVVLKFDIEPSGKVSNVRVVKATPENTFNRSAVKALSTWEYEASAYGYRNNLVQLDYALDHKQAKLPKILERIQVSSH